MMTSLNGIAAPILTCTGTTARVALGNTGGETIEIYNSGASPVFIVAGDVTVTATFPTSSASVGRVVAPGAIVTYSIPPQATYIAGISLTGTCIVYANTGPGTA